MLIGVDRSWRTMPFPNPAAKLNKKKQMLKLNRKKLNNGKYKSIPKT